MTLNGRINDDDSAEYWSRVCYFYQTFNYSANDSKTAFWIDETSNSNNRCGCCYLFKPDANLTNVGWNFSNNSQENTTTTPNYITMSGGGNNALTSAITSLQVLFSTGNIVGNIQVNSMTYQ